MSPFGDGKQQVSVMTARPRWPAGTRAPSDTRRVPGSAQFPQLTG